MRHNIEGWAFRDNEEAGKARCAARYEQIKERRREIVQALGPTVGASHYRCKVVPDLTPEDLAILCDEGNCCFGAVVVISGDTAKVTIWTD